MVEYESVILSLEKSFPQLGDTHLLTDDDKYGILTEDTPVGQVPVITFCNRSDFEAFLRYVYNGKYDVPSTQGAAVITYPDTVKTASLRKEYLAAHSNDMIGWVHHFQELKKDREAVTSTIVVLSQGPYSGYIPPIYPYEKWLSMSSVIRRYHECTHYIVKRKYHSGRTDLFDELEADTVGIYAALGKQDSMLLRQCLGIENGIYITGRLELYTAPITDAIRYIDDVLRAFEDIPPVTCPYDLIPDIEELRQQFSKR